jgi:Dienelactone hydrolase family
MRCRVQVQTQKTESQTQQQHDHFCALYMRKTFELLKSVTILLYIHDRIYVAKGLLRPQKSMLVARITRHQLFLPKLQVLSTHRPRSISAALIDRMIHTDVEANEFTYLPCDLEHWTPLNTTLFVNCKKPTRIGQETKTVDISSYTDSPRIATSAQSAQTLLNEWVLEDPDEAWSTEWKSIIYFDDCNSNTAESIPLHGYLIRNAQFHTETVSDRNKIVEPLTYVLLFPTAVGAHDLFLFFKAAQIVNHPSLRHCTVMITDLFSDPTGWVWDKATYNDQYNSIRADLLRHSISNDVSDSLSDTSIRDAPFRPMLKSRINAAFTYLNKIDATKTLVVTALGWCFGGHCIAELARMSVSVQAMITFHGVFSGLQLPPSLVEGNDATSTDASDLSRRRQSEILICHGRQDPFVPSEDLEKAL